MALNTTTNRVLYTGDGSSTVFPYPFRIFLAADLKVYVNDVSGNPIEQSLTTHYTVSGVGSEAGGNVTFLTAPANLRRVTILRSIPNTQPTQYPNNSKFPAKAHEQALDRLTMLVQQLADTVSRVPSVPVNFSGSLFEIPYAPNPALKFFRWNAAADALELVDITSPGVYVNPIISQGDLVQGGVTGAPERLGVGGTDAILRVAAGKAAWLAAPGGNSALVFHGAALAWRTYAQHLGDIGAAAAVHTHAGADITSGTIATARLGTGTPAAGKYVDGAAGAWTDLPSQTDPTSDIIVLSRVAAPMFF
jgi:hypothetical protein